MEFTKWWINEFKTVKFPSGGTVFDYYIDTETKQFAPWSESLGRFELDPDMPLQVGYNRNLKLFYLLQNFRRY